MLSISVRYFFLLIMFGFSVLPFTYLLSFLFSEPATGFSRASTINIFVGKSDVTNIFDMEECKVAPTTANVRFHHLV